MEYAFSRDQLETVTRECNKCGEVKTLKKFGISKTRPDGLIWPYRTCRACRAVPDNFKTSKGKWKKKIRQEMEDSPYLAVAELARENPDIITYLLKNYQLQYRRHLHRQRRKVFEDMRLRQERYSNGTQLKIDVERLFAELEEEFFGKPKEQSRAAS